MVSFGAASDVHGFKRQVIVREKEVFEQLLLWATMGRRRARAAGERANGQVGTTNNNLEDHYDKCWFWEKVEGQPGHQTHLDVLGSCMDTKNIVCLRLLKEIFLYD